MRWAYGCCRKRRLVGDEEAEHEPFGTSRARCKQPRPALPPQRLAHLLIRRPRLPARRWRCKVDASESVVRREVSNRELTHSVAPEIARKLMQRWYPPFREMAIPLGPQRVPLIGEVQGVDDLASLPPVVARRLRPKARIGVVRNVTQPRAGGADRIDVERQRRSPQTAPGDSSSDTTRATRRALPRAISSSGFWSSSASIGLESHTGMYSESMTRLSRSTISASSATRSARSPVGDVRRANQSRTVLGAAPTARPICLSERCATSWIRATSSANAVAICLA
jgi:hypothetical protein